MSLQLELDAADQDQVVEEGKEQNETGDLAQENGDTAVVERQTFCQRFKSDYVIVKNTVQARAIYMYILYFILAGLLPTFSAADYL